MDITAKRGYKEDYDRGSELVVHDIRQGKLDDTHWIVAKKWSKSDD